MTKNRFFNICGIFLFLLFLSGCTTSEKQTNMFTIIDGTLTESDLDNLSGISFTEEEFPLTDSFLSQIGLSRSADSLPNMILCWIPENASAKTATIDGKPLLLLSFPCIRYEYTDIASTANHTWTAEWRLMEWVQYGDEDNLAFMSVTLGENDFVLASHLSDSFLTGDSIILQGDFKQGTAETIANSLETEGMISFSYEQYEHGADEPMIITGKFTFPYIVTFSE